MKATGTTFILRDERILSRCIEFMGRLIAGPETYEVQIRPHKKKRSNPQNNLYWQWLGLLAKETGHTSEQLHEVFKRELLPRDYITLAGVEKEVAKTTTKLSTAEFTDYLEQIAAFAATELGVYLPYPDDDQYQQL